MKESYGEGPATRTGPESCAAVQRSVDRGRGGGRGPSPTAATRDFYFACAARIASALGATSCVTLSQMRSLSIEATTPGYPARPIMEGSLPDLNCSSVHSSGSGTVVLSQ